jgi:polar amino acid transport system permease protein
MATPQAADPTKPGPQGGAFAPVAAFVRAMMVPRRLVMLAIVAVIVVLVAVYGRWDWLANPKYQALIVRGIGNTLILLVLTMGIGMALAIPLGLAQAVGPWYLAMPARAFCGLIRGTPLLLQLFLLYYGIGSLFPGIPGLRESWMWPILRDAWYYAVFGLALSVAGYEGEVMRGAFKGVPSGQLEAAKAMGVPRFTLFRRIWLPQALHRVLPTLGGETVLQLKATPLVAMITVVDIYAVASRVRSETLITYEPLLLLALVYLAITAVIVLVFRWFEGLFPARVA